MTNATHQRADELQGTMAELERALKQLRNPGFYVQLFESNKAVNALISTIGVGESCEHPLAEISTEFHAKVVAFYEQELAKCKSKYAAL